MHIDNVLSDPNVSARDLASPVGKIISMSAVLGNLSSIMTKHCQMSVAAAQDWDTPSPLDRYCIVELEFWKDSLRRLNSRDLFSCKPPFISVYSDASDVACGGHILGIDVCAHRMFTNAERTQSFFPLWPFDHINVGYPAVLGQRTFTGQLFQLFFAGWQCYLPCFEESSITPCRVAVSSTRLKERSSAPLPVGRVLYAGWRFVLV